MREVIKRGVTFSLPGGDFAEVESYAGLGWWRCIRLRQGFLVDAGRRLVRIHAKSIVGFMARDLKHRAAVLERLARRMR